MIEYKKKPILIAEVKTHSPFGFSSGKSWRELFDIAVRFGDIVSVHTDPRWGGSIDLIREARALTDKPILAKGIHATDLELIDAFEAGADYALVVGRIPDLPDDLLAKCLIEPNTLAELSEIPTHLKAVWNSRDLETGGLKAVSFDQARKAFSGWLCQASNISVVSNINAGADAILVGAQLENFVTTLY